MLLIDKALNWTSFDVVSKLRKKLGVKKIGHAGTLDPLATGLLIICAGKMTREVSRFQDYEKEYTGTFLLGSTTASHDLETAITEEQPYQHLHDTDLEEAAARFRGRISQRPPSFSAIKTGGQRAYMLARKGKDVNLAPRDVLIDTFELTRIELPRVEFRVVCSKGTYIRSLARDFGEALGTGACLVKLCRTRIGPYHLKDATSVDNVQV